MKFNYQLFYSAVFAFISFPACFQAQTFTEIGHELGIDYGFSEWIDIGGGGAFFDYDADGDDDLYITGGRLADHLYRNNGDGTFTEVTSESGIDVASDYYTTGVTTGDIDNDGYREIFVTTFGEAGMFTPNLPNLLFRNNGDGTFTEISNTANINGSSRSVGAVFLDHDMDGYLDIYVNNYILNSFLGQDANGDPFFFQTCYENYLYHNNGDGTFTEVGAQLGLNDAGCTLASLTTDFDNDLDPDLYSINDFGEFDIPNILFQNDQLNGTFTDVGASTNANVGLYGMGVACSDYNLDGDLDYYITNIGSNVLLDNDGSGVFQNIAAPAGVENTNTPNGKFTTSWGTAFFDFDNNRYEDLFVANGYIPAADFIATGFLDPNKLFYNNGDGTFTDVSEAEGFDQEERARGLSYSDFDGDGDVDFFVNVMLGITADPQMRLYRNDLSNEHNWLEITLEGTVCNRDAFGSGVYVYTNGDVLIRELSGGSSHASQHSSRLHFGLGEYNQVDSVQIAWPGGDIETFYDLAINQQHHLVQSAPPTVRISFELDLSYDLPSQEGVFLQLMDSDGNRIKRLMYDPFESSIYNNSVVVPQGFSGHYTFLNGNCPDNNCAEDLSESICGDPGADFQRILTPILSDTTISLCYGICPGEVCQSTVDSFNVEFIVNPAPLDEDLDEIFIWGLSNDGIPSQLYDDDGDGLFSTAMVLPEGFSGYYIYSNGACPALDCAENLEGLDCASIDNDNYRYLPPINQDTSLLACFGRCVTDSCLAPIDTFEVRINLDMSNETVSVTGVYILGDFFGPGGFAPLYDGNDDGIYTNFFDIPEGQTIYYSFTNGLNCPDNSCAEDLSGQFCAQIEESNFRLLPPITANTTIDHCFNGCSLAQCDPSIPDSVSVSFEVNMFNTPPDPEGVFLFHYFDGLPAYEPMTDEDLDNIYSASIRLPENTSGEYLFSNGLCEEGDLSCFEQVAGQDCGQADINENLRWLNPVSQDTSITSCFGECTPDFNCTPPLPDPVAVSFYLNMANEDIDNTVQVFGSFDDAEGSLIMDNPDDPNIYTTSLLVPPGTYRYYYYNGQLATGIEEDLSFDTDSLCTTLWQEIRWRTLLVEENTPQLLDTVCFNSCENCIIDNIEELSSQYGFDFQLQPNITRQQTKVIIQSPIRHNKQIKIYHPTGQLLASYQLEPWENEYLLSLEGLPSGLYWVSLEVGAYQKVKRLIKK